MKLQNKHLQIPQLGKCLIPSPLELSIENNDLIPNFIQEETAILYNSTIVGNNFDKTAFEAAGPRKYIHFDSSKTKVAIVTCGGLCPGINNVIKSLVNELYNEYKVKNILGFKYGYAGLVPKYGYETLSLTPDLIKDWNLKGGSMLGSSRGNQDPEIMVDTLQQLNINILFTIGGDGTMRGAKTLWEEAEKRGYHISIVAVPKTIDNDIKYISRTFGFETAVAKASESIRSAIIEAEGAPRGVGLVKLMGRHSGYITAHAALSTGNVDAVLIPESPFALDGPHGLFSYVRQKLEERNRVVIVVAEGAGQDLFDDSNKEYDASGNQKLQNIGIFLSNKLKKYFKTTKPINLKYIDPSYIIRATPASPSDAEFCRQLGENAAHAAMSGKTGLVIGLWNERFTHVPLELVTKERKVIDPDEQLWRSVLQMTGQPAIMK